MSETLAPPTAAAVLLVALEPSAPRGRIEAALVLSATARVPSARRPGAVSSGSAVNGSRWRRPGGPPRDPGRHRPRASAGPSRAARPRARRTIGYDAALGLRRVERCSGRQRAPPLPPETGESDATDQRDPLTPREQKVAELAASGLPTREIAAASYLSQKTVEYHLTRVYRKLGVRSKSELVFALAGSPFPAGR